MNTAQTIQAELQSLSEPNKKNTYQRFFKTGPGEYGEGDIFIGVTTPKMRQLAKKYSPHINLTELEKLLTSKIHEHRSVALMILTNQYSKATPNQQKEIFKFYLDHTQNINNWDLVDISCYQIVGEYLLSNPQQKQILIKLAKSQDLWEQRIAMVSTFAFIRKNQLQPTLDIAQLLLNHRHDLIHKAVGWMLRELGKKDQSLLEKFLQENYQQLPRTTLRYAIERFDQDKRKKYLLGKFD